MSNTGYAVAKTKRPCAVSKRWRAHVHEGEFVAEVEGRDAGAHVDKRAINLQPSKGLGE